MRISWGQPIYLVKSKIVTAYHTKFQSLLSTDVFPKLRTYRLFKSKFEMENYLWLQIPRYRVSLARLGTSSHDLEIERGRYTIPKTPAELRVCRQCNSNMVEDEVHFLMECARHESLRENLLDVASRHIKIFYMLCHKGKFCALLSSENDMVPFALARFSHLAFRNRI